MAKDPPQKGSKQPRAVRALKSDDPNDAAFMLVSIIVVLIVCEKTKKYGNYLIPRCPSLFIIIINSHHSLSILRSSNPHRRIGNAIRCSSERCNIVNESQLQRADGR